MAKKILIAEDDKKYKDLYRQWSQQFGFEVLEVTSVDEGLEKICEVDAVITDHGLTKGNGNDLARIAKQHNLPVAGITGGNPEVFDLKYVDIAETKNIGIEKYKLILDCLFSENPRDSYNDKCPKDTDYELPAALSILLQGYYLSKSVREGRTEIALEGKVIVSAKEMEMMQRTMRKDIEPNQLFDMLRTGELKSQEVYSSICRLNPSLRNNERLKAVFDKLNGGNYDLTVEEAVYTAEKLVISDN